MSTCPDCFYGQHEDCTGIQCEDRVNDTCDCPDCWYGPPSAEELAADAQEVGQL